MKKQMENMYYVLVFSVYIYWCKKMAILSQVQNDKMCLQDF